MKPAKPSPHQLYLLNLFAHGWRFNIWTKKPGAWNTYWALRKKGLIVANSAVTSKGHEALRLYYRHEDFEKYSRLSLKDSS